MTPRVLWVSQMAPAAERSARGLPEESTLGPLALPSVHVTVVDATESPLPDPHPWDAVVVGGSVGCALDEEPWRRDLLHWLRGIGDQPFFGICGGHQLFALARGGDVARGGHDQVGIVPLCLPEHGVTEVFHSHQDAVVRPAPGSEVWARDAVGIQALRYGPAQWTVQFHPELDRETAPSLWRSTSLAYEAAALDAVVAGSRRLLTAWLSAFVTR
jgi:GMP synthase (glutamine-hydrolysing)